VEANLRTNLLRRLTEAQQFGEMNPVATGPMAMVGDGPPQALDNHIVDPGKALAMILVLTTFLAVIVVVIALAESAPKYVIALRAGVLGEPSVLLRSVPESFDVTLVHGAADLSVKVLAGWAKQPGRAG
jgi:hypothetical protein